MRISDWSSDVCSSDLVDSDRQDRQHEPDDLRGELREISRPVSGGGFSFGLASGENGRRCAGGVGFVCHRDVSSFPFSRMSCAVARLWRSEEHTSELQSLMRISYAVFCLTKKKPTQDSKQSSIILESTRVSEK